VWVTVKKSEIVRVCEKGMCVCVRARARARALRRRPQLHRRARLLAVHASTAVDAGRHSPVASRRGLSSVDTSRASPAFPGTHARILVVLVLPLLVAQPFLLVAQLLQKLGLPSRPQQDVECHGRGALTRQQLVQRRSTHGIFNGEVVRPLAWAERIPPAERRDPRVPREFPSSRAANRCEKRGKGCFPLL